MDTSYEAHIAVPEIPQHKAEALLTDLRDIGIADYDYFLRLRNLPIDNQPCQIDPETHDIDRPMIITTTHGCREKIIELVQNGMAVLQQHGIDTGNFELEADIHVKSDAHPTISDFGDFTQQDGAPKFEAHIMWKGLKNTLPSDEEIVACHRDVFQYSPNQIAEFALHPRPSADDTHWRVSTVYHETRQGVLQFLKAVSEINNAFPGKPVVIGEQICVVSDPTR